MTDNIIELYQAVGASVDDPEDGSVDFNQRIPDFEIVVTARIMGVTWQGNRQVIELAISPDRMYTNHEGFMSTYEFNNTIQIPIDGLQLLKDRTKNVD